MILLIFFFRYLISRGYGHPQDKDSGGSDDDMSDEGPDDMLPSTSRDRLDASGMYLISITLNIFVRFLNRVSLIYKSGVVRQLVMSDKASDDMLPSTRRDRLDASGTSYLIFITL